jgi:hypothetical protein
MGGMLLSVLGRTQLETDGTRLTSRSLLLVCQWWLLRTFHIHCWLHVVRNHHEGWRLFLLRRWLSIIVTALKLQSKLFAVVLVVALQVDALATLEQQGVLQLGH